jgi:hypothetical protein
LHISLPLPPADWITTRDGALTAVIDGQWLGGCSVPRRAAGRMLERSNVRGNVACLLLPTHAQQIAAALDRVGEGRAIIVLLPHAAALALVLACCDLSRPIAGECLFFAHDASSLDNLFTRHPGLPLPQQFLKLPATDPTAGEAVIAWAQEVFSKQSAKHAARLAAARCRVPASDGFCVAAGRTFCLWGDAGEALSRALDCDTIDTDQPAQSAVAHVAERSADAAALVTVDTGRADGPDLIAADKPWLTWVTQPRVPAFVPAAPRDGLLLVDAALRPAALAAGWPAGRIAVAGWPAVDSAGGGAGVALLADVSDLAPTEQIEDLSSVRLVWEACRAELLARPQAIGDDPAAYLHRVRVRHAVPAENFPEALLLERLNAPAIVVATARWLVRENVPVRLHGCGWDAFGDLAARWDGPVPDRAALAHAVASAGALIDPFILRSGHPIYAQGRPVIRTINRTAPRVLQDIAAACAGRAPSGVTTAAIDPAVVRRLLGNA